MNGVKDSDKRDSELQFRTKVTKQRTNVNVATAKRIESDVLPTTEVTKKKTSFKLVETASIGLASLSSRSMLFQTELLFRSVALKSCPLSRIVFVQFILRFR